MAQGWLRSSREHLETVGEDYNEHRRFAFAVGAAMVVSGVACILHGLIPALFTDKASRTIKRLHHLIHHREALVTADERQRSALAVLCCLSFACAAIPWLAGAQPIIAAPLSLLSLAFIIAYGWSEKGQDGGLGLLLPLRLDD